ncbi:Gfo/Idh/MocA family protein [Nocardia gipuzkoensis]|uniref:Gfo/Idh/MocA family protein n=1 Tax=Nocardia gipuzkoensis TaxID=2749991 RepID=UPI00237D84AC|nr:Gfo/Idh/MocA family oxidoreductase [Nocardia gipuzkoensis]MDE1674751.1 Gfo/Idh/MocA family oxidoreductase [Nocardia gipuzkoensis]
MTEHDDDGVRVGVVGMGWFGKTHLDAWASVRNARVVGVCDRVPEALAASTSSAQTRFHTDAGAGVDPQIPDDVARYRTVADLLDAGIDLLDVVVTEEEHEHCVRAGLEAGVSVIVEKPVAMTGPATRELVRLAEGSPGHLYVAQVLRFDPRYVALAEMVAGKPLRHLSFARHFQSAAHEVYGRAHPVLNASVHDIDAAVWLAGSAPARVTAFGSHFFERVQPDCVDVVMEWDSGLRAVVQNSWHLAASCPTGFTFDTVVHAAGATYTVRSEPTVQVWSDTATSPDLWLWPRYAGARAGALVAELQHFTDCAAAGIASNRVPLRQIVAMMDTCQAAMDALRSGVTQQLGEVSR